jgi:hypothetical protein
MHKKIALLGALVLTVASASAADVDYAAQITTNLTTVQTIWGTVAAMIIGIALVRVGAKLFKKVG